MPGYSSELFLCDSIQQYECAICLDVMKDPQLVCRMGHSFCQSCVKLTLENSRRCPSCRENINPMNCISNIVVRDIISRLKVRCHPIANNGCSWTGPLSNRDHHLREVCPLVMVTCTNPRCNAQVQRRALPSHLETCNFSVQGCSYCGKSFYRSQIGNHKLACTKRPFNCTQGCNQIMQFCDFKDHKKVCPNGTVKCPLKLVNCCSRPDCNGFVVRRDLKNHVSSLGSVSEAVVKLIGSNLHLQAVNKVLMLQHTETEPGIGNSSEAVPVLLRWLDELKQAEDWDVIKKISDQLSTTTNTRGERCIARHVVIDAVDISAPSVNFQMWTGKERYSENLSSEVTIEKTPTSCCASLVVDYPCTVLLRLVFSPVSMHPFASSTGSFRWQVENPVGIYSAFLTLLFLPQDVQQSTSSSSSSSFQDLRSQLNKDGKRVLDEFSALVERTSGDSSLVYKKAERLVRKYPLTPLRFMNFNDFVRFGSCPRFPDCKTKNLESIDRDNSLLVFISHCWLRGHIDDQGRPHPDNAKGDKFKLCVNGLRMIKDRYAPSMRHCYIWMDYSCMNQDKQNLSDDLKRYDKIVQCCDAIFTPIVDINHRKWSYDTIATEGCFVDYKAKLWNQGPHAYLNRAWCRAEMMYAAAIPVLQNTNPLVERHTKFEAGLAVRCRENKRAHILYGSKEDATGGYKLFFLPSLDFSFFRQFNPLEGKLSKESDRIHVANLIEELKKYDVDDTLGYAGPVNAQGLPHGKGKFTPSNGILVEGDWAAGDIEGQCRILYENEEYEGEWKNNAQHGRGRYKFPDGSVYEGEWKHGAMEGEGVMRYADGSLYEGGWKDDNMSGQGRMVYPDGTVYEGEWENGAKNGNGVLRDINDGSVYEGSWKNDLMHGEGIMMYSNGEEYHGKWKNHAICGPGELRSASSVKSRRKAPKRHLY